MSKFSSLGTKLFRVHLYPRCQYLNGRYSRAPYTDRARCYYNSRVLTSYDYNGEVLINTLRKPKNAKVKSGLMKKLYYQWKRD